MTTAKRVFASIAVIASGWALMGLAYDKPESYFQLAGVLGVSLALGSAVWWVTGTFTAEARREATRDGAPPIELNDGEKLLDMLEKLELGLKPVTTFEVEHAFFKEFEA